jgi:hypothetical protein
MSWKQRERIVSRRHFSSGGAPHFVAFYSRVQGPMRALPAPRTNTSGNPALLKSRAEAKVSAVKKF